MSLWRLGAQSKSLLFLSKDMGPRVLIGMRLLFRIPSGKMKYAICEANYNPEIQMSLSLSRNAISLSGITERFRKLPATVDLLSVMVYRIGCTKKKSLKADQQNGSHQMASMWHS